MDMLRFFNLRTFSYKLFTGFLKKKAFIFQKISFKVKVFKTFKISSDGHIKKCQKSLVPLF